MKFVWKKEEKYFNLETNFSKEGKKIRKNGKPISHPVIVFITNKDVYFLNARSAYEKIGNKLIKKRRINTEILLTFENRKPSYVDVSSIQIMNINDFFKIYKNEDIYNLNKKQRKRFYIDFKEFLNEGKKITIQYVFLKQIGDKNITFNKVVYSNILEVIWKRDLKKEEKIAGLAQLEYIKNTLLCINELSSSELDDFDKCFVNTDYLLKKSRYLPLEKIKDKVSKLLQSEAKANEVEEDKPLTFDWSNSKKLKL